MSTARGFDDSELRDAVAGYGKRSSRIANPQSHRERRIAALEQWKGLVEHGLAGVGVPETLGGCGGSIIDAGTVAEHMGAMMLESPFIPVTALAGRLLMELAANENGVSLLRSMLRGDTVTVFAHAERGMTRRGECVDTRAQIMSDGTYRLNGSKIAVMHASLADSFVISARICDKKPGGDGIGLFALKSQAPGVALRSYFLIDGSPAGDLDLTQVPVDRRQFIGSGFVPLEAIHRASEYATMCAGAEIIGIMDGLLTESKEYMRLRRQYGGPLASFQALRHRFVEMWAAVELSRSLMQQSMKALARGPAESARKEVRAAMAKALSAASFVTSQAIQLHGAIGVTAEHRAAKCFRRVRVLAELFGNRDAQLEWYEIC